MKYDYISLRGDGGKMGEKNKAYSKEFKLDAIRLYLSGEHGGYTPVARALNITRANLINWVNRYSKLGEFGLEDGRGKGSAGQFVLPPKIEGLPINEENIRLKAENAYLRSLLELNIDIIKKTYYEVIDKLRKDFSLNILLNISGIKRSSYYKWKKNLTISTKRKQDDILISGKIKILYAKHKGRYGVHRMKHALLNDYNLVVNHKRVYRLMKEHSCLAVIKAKKHFKQPERKHSGVNILNRNFEASYPFDKLATDVSVIKKSGKSIYISPIKDLCTNMIESWDISYNASLKVAINPLLSIKDEALPKGTFMH